MLALAQRLLFVQRFFSDGLLDGLPCPLRAPLASRPRFLVLHLEAVSYYCALVCICPHSCTPRTVDNDGLRDLVVASVANPGSIFWFRYGLQVPVVPSPPLFCVRVRVHVHVYRVLFSQLVRRVPGL